jgi:hypothetical protein
MNDQGSASDGDFVLSTGSEPVEDDVAGGAQVGDAARASMRRRHVANPDDPPVPVPLRDRRGRVPAPDTYFLGRMAIVQGQVYIVAVILVVQLWLVTTALFELLSGHGPDLWGLAITSGIGFVIALVVALWPRRRVSGQ